MQSRRRHAQILAGIAAEGDSVSLGDPLSYRTMEGTPLTRGLFIIEYGVARPTIPAGVHWLRRPRGQSWQMGRSLMPLLAISVAFQLFSSLENLHLFDVQGCVEVRP